jgi:hypothetical protein
VPREDEMDGSSATDINTKQVAADQPANVTARKPVAERIIGHLRLL